MKKVTVALGALALIACGTSAWASMTEITTGNHYWLHVANPEGVKYNYDDTAAASAFSAPPVTAAPDNNSYYVSWGGGGLNALHVTTDAVTAPTGQQTATAATSGTFFLTTTGGGGAAMDNLLIVSTPQNASNNFTLNIQSSGLTYSGTPGASSTVAGGINETFTNNNLMYHAAGRPGGSSLISWDGSSPFPSESYMVIDLGVGTIPGTVTVNYSLTGIDAPTTLSFNTLGWSLTSNQKEGINWSNNTLSGYTVNAIPTPTPVPPALLLFGSGLFGLFGFSRKRRNG